MAMRKSICHHTVFCVLREHAREARHRRCTFQLKYLMGSSVDYSTVRGGASLSIEIAKMDLLAKKRAILFFLCKLFYNKLDDNLNVVTAIWNDLICEVYKGNLLFYSWYSGDINSASS